MSEITVGSAVICIDDTGIGGYVLRGHTYHVRSISDFGTIRLNEVGSGCHYLASRFSLLKVTTLLPGAIVPIGTLVVLQAETFHLTVGATYVVDGWNIGFVRIKNDSDHYMWYGAELFSLANLSMETPRRFKKNESIRINTPGRGCNDFHGKIIGYNPEKKQYGIKFDAGSSVGFYSESELVSEWDGTYDANGPVNKEEIISPLIQITMSPLEKAEHDLKFPSSKILEIATARVEMEKDVKKMRKHIKLIEASIEFIEGLMNNLKHNTEYPNVERVDELLETSTEVKVKIQEIKTKVVPKEYLSN